MKFNSKNSFKSLDNISSSGKEYKIFNLKIAEKNGLDGISKLPKSLKVLLENLLRYEDDVTVDKKQILESGIIQNSKHIQAFDSKGNMNANFISQYKLISNDNDYVVLISQSGDISSILANGLIENLGMKNIYSLRGGIDKWSEKGNSLEKL